MALRARLILLIKRDALMSHKGFVHEKKLDGKSLGIIVGKGNN
jgi:hypothetical protein